MLKEGAFGNTNPHWDDLHAWAHANKFGYLATHWGIRSMGAGKNLRLDVPILKVADVIKKEFSAGYQISPMVDKFLTYRGELMFTEDRGLVIRGGPMLRHIKWRQFFADYAENIAGLRAWQTLRKYFNGNSYDDMIELMKEYPDHVIEFTACDRNIGTHARRNVIIWEVRPTDGSYENWKKE